MVYFGKLILLSGCQLCTLGPPLQGQKPLPQSDPPPSPLCMATCSSGLWLSSDTAQSVTVVWYPTNRQQFRTAGYIPPRAVGGLFWKGGDLCFSPWPHLLTHFLKSEGDWYLPSCDKGLPIGFFLVRVPQLGTTLQDHPNFLDLGLGAPGLLPDACLRTSQEYLGCIRLSSPPVESRVCTLLP